MKSILTFLTIATMALLSACSQMQKEPTAKAYVQPAESKACDDSLENFAAAAGASANFDGFKSIYEHFIQLNPKSTELQNDYQSLFDSYDMDDAKAEYYKKLYDQDQNSAMYAYLYGKTLIGGEAEKMYRRAVELDPNYYWGNLALATRLISKTPSDTANAIKSLMKCIEIDNGYPSAFDRLTNIYYQSQDYANALKFADLLAITSPDQFRPIDLKTDILIARGEKAKAEEALVAFAQKNAKDVSSRRKLVQFYRNQKRYSDALNYQRQLAGMTSKPGDAIFEVAKIFVQANQTDSAIAYLKQAIAMGFIDYRRVARNPLFDPLRATPGFAEVAKDLQAAAAQQREMRLASFQSNAESQKQSALGEKLEITAPDFAFTNLAGQTVKLADLKGKVVVVDFWATWCGPCRMTMPLLQEFVDSLPNNVEFLSMDVWEKDTSLVRPFLADYGYSFNVLFGDKDISDRYQVSGIPTLFVIDKNGVIRYKHIGYDPNADQLLTWQTQSLM